MKCKNFLCGRQSQGKKGYCLKCIHSIDNVMSKCFMCENTYITTIGITKKYCSSTCRSRAYYIRKKLNGVMNA